MSNKNDIGNRCVKCGEDTSFGSGRFVNRIPADATYESLDKNGNIIFKEGEYREGYACAECMAFECCRCDEMIPMDEDVTPYDCGSEEAEFSDGAYRVHHECLTKIEKIHFKAHSA
tara:strand:+ start:1312 stop:1659 length:348 start_codon:yes stop_codon:yes gene_type:complete